MEDLITTCLIGLALGCIYGIIALGLTAIYNATRLINFAHGDFAMIGAMIAAVLMAKSDLPLPLVIVALALGAVAFAMALQYVMVEPLRQRGAPPLTVIMIVMAGSMMLEGVMGTILGWGTQRVPPIAGFTPWKIGEVILGKQYVAIIVATLVLSAAYWLFLTRTRFGLALRATGDNPAGAVAVGISVRGTTSIAFAISAIIGAIAGYLVGPIVVPSVLMGFPLLLKGFVACVVGGLGRPFAGVFGGILLGLVGSFVSTYSSGGWSELAVFLTLIAVLVIRPGGLLGGTTA